MPTMPACAPTPTHAHSHPCTHVHTYAQMHTHKCTHRCTHPPTHAHMMHMCTHRHAHTQVHTHNIGVHTRPHAHTTHAHAHACTHTGAHTHMPFQHSQTGLPAESVTHRPTFCRHKGHGGSWPHAQLAWSQLPAQPGLPGGAAAPLAALWALSYFAFSSLSFSPSHPLPSLPLLSLSFLPSTQTGGKERLVFPLDTLQAHMSSVWGLAPGLKFPLLEWTSSGDSAGVGGHLCCLGLLSPLLGAPQRFPRISLPTSGL